MQTLMEEGGKELRQDVARALTVWAEPDDGSVKVVREAAESMVKGSEDVPKDIITFLVAQKDEESIPLIYQLWSNSPSDWEAIFSDMGSLAEDSVLPAIASDEPLQVVSAARILRRIGTEKSLPKLRTARETAKTEQRILIDQAIDAIQRRK